MSTATALYCLDANVLIQAWQKYYSPKFCPDYWKVLDEYGSRGTIFLPEAVYDEVVRTDDALSSWFKQSKLPIHKISGPVTRCLQDIYNHNISHKNLVDNTRNRSLADPWIIAHALHNNATVVTKEEKITALNSNRIKIPNVCENMGIRWINDFQLIEELGIYFSCK